MPPLRRPLANAERVALAFAARPGTRILVYYALMFGLGAILWRTVPDGTQREVLAAFAPHLLGGAAAAGAAADGQSAAGAFGALLQGAGVGTAGKPPIPLEVAGATLGAFLLALPVAWTYMVVRERKGYRQSVVHTLILLPVVVAGVVVLVKTSVALAFSLAGIVAAVRFRNTLDDSKDATFLFLTVGIGLAAGVELDVALVLSVAFNAISLLLFYTDFARIPPQLEGERAKKQLERAMDIANRTGQFVARVDEEVLRGLAPEQLDALASRLRRRREQAAPDLPSVPELEFDARLRITATDADAVRALVEPVLDQRVKRWSLDTVLLSTADGEEAIAYHVRWKKGVTPAAVLEAVRLECAPFVVRAEVA
jgi:hypothetical protein